MQLYPLPALVHAPDAVCIQKHVEGDAAHGDIKHRLRAEHWLRHRHADKHGVGDGDQKLHQGLALPVKGQQSDHQRGQEIAQTDGDAAGQHHRCQLPAGKLRGIGDHRVYYRGRHKHIQCQLAGRLGKFAVEELCSGSDIADDHQHDENDHLCQQGAQIHWKSP